MADRLEGLRSDAHRLSLRLMTVAGLMTGLLLGIGILFLGQSLRAAVALWALMLAVGALMLMIGHHVRRQADDLHAVGRELQNQQVEALRRTAEATNALGDLRAHVMRLERRIGELEDRDPAAPLGVAVPDTPAAAVADPAVPTSTHASVAGDDPTDAEEPDETALMDRDDRSA